MRLCTLKLDGEQAAVAVDGGYVPIADVNAAAGTGFPVDLLEIIRGEHVDALATIVEQVAYRLTPLARDGVRIAPPYRNPPKLWGIGLNYRAHADDLEAVQPTSAPGSYMRPNTTIIGPADDVVLPAQSDRVTAEAELGLIIGRDCKDVSIQDAPSVIFGYTVVLDMTAEDLLRENLRYILRCKAFDTFCAIGPEIVTADEVADLASVRTATILNGEVRAQSPVSDMMYDPYWLVSFHSRMMRLEAGDIIATGTPGASVIRHGDVITGRVTGVGELTIGARSQDANQALAVARVVGE